MNRRTLLRRISNGAVNNVPFGDFTDLLAGFGFELRRINGSHHIFSHSRIDEMVNVQQVGRQAKPYQMRQVLRLAEKYSLHLEDWNMRDYHINIFYSEEDAGYIADIPDLQDCSAFGNSPEEALAEVRLAMAAWLKAAKDLGKPVPEPRYRPAIYQI